MNERQAIVVFVVDGQRLALPLSSVQRAVRAVEIAPLPQMPSEVLGAINVQGQVLPVISVRRWLARPERELEPQDHLLVVQTRTRRLALLVDEVHGVAECELRQTPAVGEQAGGLSAACEIIKLEEALVLVPDLEGVFSETEVLVRETDRV